MVLLSCDKCDLNQDLDKADFELLLRWINDFNTIRYFSLFDAFRFMTTPEELRSFFRRFLQAHQSNEYFFIYTKRKEFAGYIVLSGSSKGIGILVGRPYWRRSYGLHSMLLVLEYVFNVLRRRKSSLSTCVKNVRAIALFKKLGYKAVRHVPRDHVYYVRRKSEILRRRTTRVHLELDRKDFKDIWDTRTHLPIRVLPNYHSGLDNRPSESQSYRK